MRTLDREPILNAHRRLLVAIEQLQSLLYEHATGAITHGLPLLIDDQQVSDHIPVKTRGSVARLSKTVLSQAVDAFSKFHRAPGQKITSVYRLPGVIVVASDLSRQIQLINAIKDELRASARQCYPRTYERSRALQQIFPSIHMNQLYRHLYWAPEHTHRLNLTWQTKSRADVWITPAVAIAQALDAIREEQQRMEPDTNKIRSLNIALKHFKNLPRPRKLPTLKALHASPAPQLAYQLLQRSVVRPHPRVQLFELPKGSKAFATHPANLPVIAHSTGQSLDVRPLSDYQADRFSPRSDSKSGFEQISSTLSIFGGIPSADMVIRRIKLQRAND